MDSTETITETVRELRRDLVTGRWVVVNSELARQPGVFARQNQPPCRVCAGDSAPALWVAGDDRNWRVKVIPAWEPALRVEGIVDGDAGGLWERRNGVGAHELVMESPVHGVRLGSLPEGRMEEVFSAIRARMVDLRRDHRLQYFSVFRQSVGETHGYWEILALPVLPDRWLGESARTYRYFEAHQRCATCDLLERELAAGLRVIASSDDCVVFAPYASRNPFEVWIVPRPHSSHFENATELQLAAAAQALRDIARRMDAILEHPDVLVTLQTAGSQEIGHHGLLGHAHWRIEVVPRLLASRGIEAAAQAFLNPVAPEDAAHYLRRPLPIDP